MDVDVEVFLSNESLYQISNAYYALTCPVFVNNASSENIK